MLNGFYLFHLNLNLSSSEFLTRLRTGFAHCFFTFLFRCLPLLKVEPVVFELHLCSGKDQSCDLTTAVGVEVAQLEFGHPDHLIILLIKKSGKKVKA